MLNTNITRRQALLIAAGVVTVAVGGTTFGIRSATDGTGRYEIIYELDGGKNPKDQTLEIEQGTTIEVKKLKSPTKRGYSFAGWYDNDWLEEKATKIYGDRDKDGRTLYAKWKLVKYAISYNPDGGEQTVRLPRHFTVKTPTLGLFACTKSGYSFGGWYKDKSLTQEVYHVKKGSAGDKTLYAKWTQAGYWDDHLKAKCAQINAHCKDADDHGSSFIFITDMHFPDNCLYSFELIDRVRAATPVKRVVFGGDAINWSTTAREARRILSALRAGLTKNGPAHFIRGNHDANDQGHVGNDATLPDWEFYDLVLDDANYVEPEGLYFYRDDEERKIRYFFLDTGHPGGGGIDAEQLFWLGDHMLELGKSWGIVIFLHRYYLIRRNYEMEPPEPELDFNGERLNDLIDAVHEYLEAKIICVVCGHCHRDRSTVRYFEDDEELGGYLVFSTTCDAYGQARVWDDAHPVRQRGTTDEQAFDVVTIDRKARKIYATRIGCGDDREFSY